MDLERGSVSSSSASSPLSAADRLELEAAEALAGLAYLATRETVPDSAAKWGRKGKRLKKRVKSESPPSPPPPPPPPSDSVLNPADPVQTGSDPVEEDQTKVGKQQVEIRGSNEFIESVKAEQNSESLELSHCCVARYKSTGGGRPRQNLTEAEKEARRLRRILANRESARQTIRRRQVSCVWSINTGFSFMFLSSAFTYFYVFFLVSLPIVTIHPKERMSTKRVESLGKTSSYLFGLHTLFSACLFW
ncbi:hypothetical protein SLEP1_g11356 [Rubroshorea leprosula]|uniref:Uncharacterized protein n=1 Tax=Rubroshorea leprosula TaxID=152421 RepID=A0AAV5IKG7_9ROSI|nr:hypothetical protein SLEP1_g11356 [Rubroshorea leprosula]